MEKISLIISLSDNHPEIKEIVKNLSMEGFKVENVLMSIGVITGESDASSVSRLMSIDGVASVEEAQEMNIS